MKKIKLTQGKYAIIDDKDYEELSKHKWYAAFDLRVKKYYARRRVSGTSTKLNMHRFILNTPKGMFTDHINRNTLDNRRKNLRTCTSNQNAYNSEKPSCNTSGYKGVTFKYKKWQVIIKASGKQIYLGRFTNKEDAARAYNNGAKKHHGEFACLNKI